MSLYIYDEYRRAVVKSDTGTPEYINLDAREGGIIAKHLNQINNLWESNKQKQSQLTAANARIAELEAQLNAELTVQYHMRSQIDAVPVEAIRHFFRPYGEVRDLGLAYRSECNAKVKAWLDAQVQP